MHQRQNVVLTSTDVELFRWLWMLRVMTLDQLRRVGYYQNDTGRLSSLDNVRKRLRRLAEAGYFAGDRLLGTRQRIYFLEKRSLQSLRERYAIRQQRLYQPRSLETLRQLQHALLVSECGVRVAESRRGSDFSVPNLPPFMVPFYHTHAVEDPRRKKHVERFVSQEDLKIEGHPQPLRIRPDLVFALAQNERARLYFLEADRGSEGVGQIAEKQLAYHHYCKTPDPVAPSRWLWQRYGDVSDFRVLFVTTDKRRVANLVRGLSSKPGFELMTFATATAVQAQNMLFDEIWTNQHGQSRALARRLYVG